ncbi:transposable element Tcb2 transposase [Trichonephila clavipes]|uniref:Transposable element Tcb2 transposase n=1 Tax=Trichonephila clavipes TaxID=2585209 RepID=A0A8X6WE02_TRICX|nr:transposable element Tcb2 transposase [Trichonephila clavipes]
MSQQRNLPESMAWRVIGRLESGQTQCSVADAVGVARSVVARLWNPFQETGNVRRRPGAGRPRATTSTDDRYIQLTVRRNRTENATQLQRQLLLATGRRVSSQTVRNRLHEGGLYARRPMFCIPLTPRHRAARRRWAAEHRDWEQHDWSQVLFTDESQFSLECDTRRVLVWRDRGTRNKPTFVRERSQYRRAGWMVLGGISIGGRTDLHIIRNGTLTGRRYADEILRPHVIPYAGAIGDSFVFQDDNARPHRARLVENMLEAETIQRMEWPACSPDLNPWEYVWDMLGRRIAARPRPPATVRDMEIALHEEWNSIPQTHSEGIPRGRFPENENFDQTPYKLPPPTPIHIPAEKRPLEEKSLPFSKRRSKVRITNVMRRVSRRPELRMAPGQISEPVQVLHDPEPMQILDVPQPLVQIPPELDPLEPTDALDQLMSFVFEPPDQEL